jgi:histone arginine demethylase JMJD6
MEGLTDDSPLAIYDAEFGHDKPTNELVGEYTVPPCFSPDLFDLVMQDQHRPPYQWILIGPARSGTGLHIDPLWTNAWVTVLEGCKRWMLFPPDTKCNEIGMQSPQIPSVLWFRDYYPKLVDKYHNAVEILQGAGDTVFVPAGWPHVVLNLEITVAVTHNYASEFQDLTRLWKEVSQEEPDFGRQWYEALQQHRPDLVQRLQIDCTKWSGTKNNVDTPSNMKSREK